MELLDATGRVVQSARTAYDGFYSLSEIPVGRYRLQVHPPRHLAHLYHPCLRDITLYGDAPILDGTDLTLQPTSTRLVRQARAGAAPPPAP